MGIEPTREVVPDLENKQFGAIMNAKCDGRVNFPGMWGHAGLRRDTSVGEISGFEPTKRRSLSRPTLVGRRAGKASVKRPSTPCGRSMQADVQISALSASFAPG